MRTPKPNEISANAGGTLFTLGYEKRSIDEFVQLLRDASIGVLVDVRETAWSHKPGFSKAALAKALGDGGIDYVHARFAGNPKHIRAKAASNTDALQAYAAYLDAHPEIVAEFEQLVAALLASGKRVCLTCFERRPEECHRRILAERWGRGGRRSVEHLL